MDQSSLWHSAYDLTAAIDREYPNGLDMTLDQRLKLAEIMALLAVGQELSSFNPSNTTTFVDGVKKNAWGMTIPD